MSDNNVIQKGQDNPVKRYYHIWLLAIVSFVTGYIIKNYHKIRWRELSVYFWITLLSSYFWQTQLCHFPNDIVCAWNFFDTNVLFEFLILGGTFEDMVLFHPFGMLFGYFIINKFPIFSNEENNKKHVPLKIVFFSIIGIALLYFAIFIDYSSRMAFVIFALPGFILLFTHLKSFNIIPLFIYIPIMLLFVFGWDYTSVVLLQKIGNSQYWASWIYKLNGQHSLVYSQKQWMWLFGQLPLSIDIIYPLSGMIMQIGLISWRRKAELK